MTYNAHCDMSSDMSDTELYAGQISMTRPDPPNKFQ